MASTVTLDHETPTERDELVGTAYHEAGYAVLNVVLRLSFMYASIVPDDEAGSLGHVRGVPMGKKLVERINYGTPTLRDRDHLESHAISSLAGMEAERRYLGADPSEASIDGDIRLARLYADRISSEPNELSAYLEWLRLRAVNALKDSWNWKAVERVAAELVARKVVSSKRIRQIVRQANDDYFERLRQQSERRRPEPEGIGAAEGD